MPSASDLPPGCRDVVIAASTDQAEAAASRARGEIELALERLEDEHD
jgi:hypothetical protein